MRLIILLAGATAVLAACQQTADNSSENAATNQAAAPMTESERAGAAAGLPAQSVAGQEAARIMHDRHENYEKIGDAMKVITRELKASSPDMNAVRQNAATISQLAPQILGWFPPGSGPEAGKTEAKAEIWQRPEDFAAKSLAFSHAAVVFQTAAQGTDLTAIRAAHANLGKSCKACHDLYREEDH